MENNISLAVYTPVTGTSVFIEDIAPYAVDYWHSIRRLGGYWMAGWKMYEDDIGPAMYDQWRTNRKFYHLKEDFSGQTSWEGSIETIQVDDSMGLLDVTAYGYVHSIQNKYNSTTDTGTTDADAWLEVMRSTDCEFIASGYLYPNPLQCYKAGTDKVWDEMLKVVELGTTDAPVHPMELGVYQDRRLYYNMVSGTPRGYVSGGIRWREDTMNDLQNYIIVRYTDETGAAQTDYEATLAESTALYGRREMRLERTYLPTASATALASAYLYEHAYPKMRAVGCGRDIQVYDNMGCNKAISPWLVLPGVYRDMSIPHGTTPYLDWLDNSADFMVDEVVARDKGVQLKTSTWTELDTIDALYDYMGDIPKEPGRKGKRKRSGTNSTSGSGTGSGSTSNPSKTKRRTPPPSGDLPV